jgi:oligopeptide transport system substrate-binding protein
MARLYFRRVRLLVLILAITVTAAHGADPSKILRITFQAAETGFDPVKVSDYYSGTVIEAIFDPLLTYDYLARPARLVPNTAAALPQISDRGRTYRVSVKPGIHFANDAVFKGKKRELTALDYA